MTVQAAAALEAEMAAEDARQPRRRSRSRSAEPRRRERWRRSRSRDRRALDSVLAYGLLQGCA